MADKKISALTSATLPLAGTEVLPIVQSSTTVKVATDNLTVKNVRSNATSGILQVAGPGAGATRTMTTPDANFTAARTDAAQSFTGDQTLSTGNLIQGVAAKGINFTANTPAAGMTSQLLNWYEEGTYTATLTPNTSGTITLDGSVNLFKYTRIGRLVTVTGRCTVSSVSSPVGSTVGLSLPFAISASTESESRIGGAISSYNNVTTVNYAFIGDSGSSVIDIYVSAASIAAGMSFSVSFSYCV